MNITKFRLTGGIATHIFLSCTSYTLPLRCTLASTTPQLNICFLSRLRIRKEARKEIFNSLTDKHRQNNNWLLIILSIIYRNLFYYKLLRLGCCPFIRTMGELISIWKNTTTYPMWQSGRLRWLGWNILTWKTLDYPIWM